MPETSKKEAGDPAGPTPATNHERIVALIVETLSPNGFVELDDDCEPVLGSDPWEALDFVAQLGKITELSRRVAETKPKPNLLEEDVMLCRRKHWRLLQQ
jgi:hypothetical protein